MLGPRAEEVLRLPGHECREGPRDDRPDPGTYGVERQAKEESAALGEGVEAFHVRRCALRQEYSRPVLDTIKEKLDEWFEDAFEGCCPRAPWEGMRYARNNWKALERYLESGDLNLDDNSVEREMRGPAVGRRNWTFFGSEAGGRWAATIYSFVATCKRNGIDPRRVPRHLSITLDAPPAPNR